MQPTVEIKALECKDGDGSLDLLLILTFDDRRIFPIQTTEELDTYNLPCPGYLDFTQFPPEERPILEFSTEVEVDILLVELPQGKICKMDRVKSTQKGEYIKTASCFDHEVCITYYVNNTLLLLTQAFIQGFISGIRDLILLVSSFIFSFLRLIVSLPARLFSSTDESDFK